MAVPGFTAELSLATGSGSHRHRTAEVSHQDGLLAVQTCAVETLATCSFWLQSCFYGPCVIPRIFGSGACSTCMTGCLWTLNPLLATVCSECVTAAPCTFRSPTSGTQGCPFNLCG